MIKLKNNKLILNYCKNFERIVNTDFLEGDILSIQLVRIYKDFIFNIELTEQEIQKAIEIDKIMGRYIDDYLFRKTLKQELTKVKVKKSCSDIIKTIVENIIEIFHRVDLSKQEKYIYQNGFNKHKRVYFL